MPKPVPKAKPAKAKPAAGAPARTIEMEVLDGILDEMGDASGAQLLGSDGLSLKIRGVISTQNFEIDGAIGRGGVPLGRLTIVHGGEASGKTTLALHLVSEVQKMGGIAVYIDLEYKLDPDYAAKLGVDTKRLIISQPPHLEAAFMLVAGVVKRAAALRERLGKRVPILVVLDSMNAAITKHMHEAEYDAIEMAGPARVMSAKLPKLIPIVSKEDVALVFISQVRKKMNVMYGDDEEIACGNAPKFYASLVLHVKRLAKEREGENTVGNKVRIECKKNQIAPPFKKADVMVRFGKGFDKEQAVITRGVTLGVLEHKGTTFSLDGEKIGIGIGNACKALRRQPELRARVFETVRKAEAWGG